MFKSSSSWCPVTLSNKIKKGTFFFFQLIPLWTSFFSILWLLWATKSPLLGLLAFPSHGQRLLQYPDTWQQVQAPLSQILASSLRSALESSSLCYRLTAKPAPNPHTAVTGLRCSAALLLCWYNPCYSSCWTGLKTHQISLFPWGRGREVGWIRSVVDSLNIYLSSAWKS